MTDYSESSMMIEWNGREYEVRYTFKLNRYLRARRLKMPTLFMDFCRAGAVDPAAAAAEYAGDAVEILHAVMCHVGIQGVTVDDLFDMSLDSARSSDEGDAGVAGMAIEVLVWLGQQHYRISPDAPTGDPVAKPEAAKKPAAKKPAAKASRGPKAPK